MPAGTGFALDESDGGGGGEGAFSVPLDGDGADLVSGLEVFGGGFGGGEFVFDAAGVSEEESGG